MLALYQDIDLDIGNTKRLQTLKQIRLYFDEQI